MFQKRISLNTLDEMMFQLDDHDFQNEDVADKADTVMYGSDYSYSMKKKLQSELTTTFKAYKVLHAELKQDLRNKAEEICFSDKYNQRVMAFYYLCLMLLSHKNLPPMLASLKNAKKIGGFFTLKIFMHLLPEESKNRAASTIYETSNQFLMQLVHFDFLTKVDQLYKTTKLNLDWEQKEFAERVIKALPPKYEEGLRTVFEIEEQEEQTSEAV